MANRKVWCGRACIPNCPARWPRLRSVTHCLPFSIASPTGGDEFAELRTGAFVGGVARCGEDDSVRVDAGVPRNGGSMCCCGHVQSKAESGGASGRSTSRGLASAELPALESMARFEQRPEAHSDFSINAVDPPEKIGGSGVEIDAPTAWAITADCSAESPSRCGCHRFDADR